MRYEYDHETDILTIKLRDTPPDYGEQVETIITHYGADGKPVEIEILDASETVLDFIRPILARAPKPAQA